MHIWGKVAWSQKDIIYVLAVGASKNENCILWNARKVGPNYILLIKKLLKNKINIKKKILKKRKEWHKSEKLGNLFCKILE